MIPASWMPPAKMRAICVHWNAGSHKASALDKAHYHIMIEDDGRLVLGKHSIKANERPVKGRYAAHCLNFNTGVIGVSLCGMRDAVEPRGSKPGKPGPEPLTRKQWDVLPQVLAELCKAYRIPVTPKTVLSHAEVQNNLGIRQRGKIDIWFLPFDPKLDTPREVGDAFRARTAALLK